MQALCRAVIVDASPALHKQIQRLRDAPRWAPPMTGIWFSRKRLGDRTRDFLVMPRGVSQSTRHALTDKPDEGRLFLA
ncbi:hypothetical protein DPM35_29830 [Mesorhizobium atlanticum]|uniref:Uncharacterized protein n=1 Tax=Mesorhizobium atlanticum TaxID=2233532 RepID=A0A330GGL8_9HYPH|nr:hypothetical protein DPM35_29830 [Mesorhizobium atlanticum]